MKTVDAHLEKLFRRPRPWMIVLTGTILLAALYAFPSHVQRVIADEQNFQQRLSKTLDQTAAAREHIVSLEMLKTADLERLKVGLSGNAQSQKSLFESGLSLQEERRLLEKQLEIMTTTLFVNPLLQRVFLMRAEQPLQSYLISYVPLRAFGGARMTFPPSVRVISKERFAHPERGKSEEVNGSLQWVPPQVGTSVRSNALGEFVMFTNSALIIHGPPLNARDHERFPHVCLGLDQEAARKLYRASFIGTRVTLNHVTVEKAEPTEDLVPAIPPAR